MEKLKSIFQAIILIEEKLGLTKLVGYVTFFLIIYGIFNFQTIVKTAIDIQENISKEEHQRKLRLRDELLDELPPLLAELRIRAQADRVLYFEYHNSTENFIGIPFKFINLVSMSQEYGIPKFDPEKYKDINAGLLGNLYTDLNKKGVIIKQDNKYPEIHEFFSTSDGSSFHMFINIPGIEIPIGIIVLEWIEPKENLDLEELEDWVIRKYVPRISHLMQSKIE